MPIVGYVDTLNAIAVGGWTYDTDAPDETLHVEVQCAGAVIASGLADRFRPDLATNRVGDGRHAFWLSLEDTPLAPEELSRVTAWARRDDGHLVEVARWQPRTVVPSGQHRLKPIGDPVDSEQHPVFVIGAPRSGTSAVAQGLLHATSIRGHQEGHVIQLLGELDGAMQRHFGQKSEDVAEPLRNTMIKAVPSGYFADGFAALFVAAMRQLFPDGRWLDKTPDPPMILLAPRLARIWPNARFIFMRRRPLENVASRERKFGETNVTERCRWWSTSMEAWASVRESLHGRALELDQLCLARDPGTAAAEVGRLLTLDAATVQRLASVYATHRPEQTGPQFGTTLDAADLGWSAKQWENFDKLCGHWMTEYGYSRDRRYFSSDRPENWFVHV